MKTALISIASTLLTLFLVRYWPLIFPLLYMGIGLRHAMWLRGTIYNDGGFWFISIFLWPIGWLAMPEEYGPGAKADLKKLLGGRKVQFQWPVVITKEP